MRAVLALVLACCLHAAAPAGAQDASALVEEGLALRRQGRDAEAADRFRRAHAIDRSARSLAQVALAEQAAGEWVAAERDLVLALALNDAWIAEHRSVLDAALATIRTHVGRLTVVCNVEGAELFVDGRHAAVLPLSEPIATEVGTHVVEVRAAGHVATQRSAAIRAGELSRVSIELVARAGEIDPVVPDPRVRDSAGETPPPERVGGGPSPLLVAGLGGAGAGALALAATLVAVGVREDNVQRWNDEAQCPVGGPGGRLTSCAAEYATLRSAEDWAIGLGVAVGVLALGSAVLIALGAGEASPQPALALSPDGAYASIRVRF